MKVAVTGAAGYVGAWLLSALLDAGHEVHGQDIREENELDWASFWVFDLSSEQTCKQWLESVQPDVVIHLAALYGRVWGEVDKAKTAWANAGLTAVIARVTAQCGARLMYVSSSEVYGESANAGAVHPWSPLYPLNMYGLTKKWGEEAACLYAPDGLVIARLNMPYGPSLNPPPRGSQDLTSGRPGIAGYNVLHSMTWQAAHGMDLVVHQGTTRCFTWIADTVRGLVTIMESGKWGTWNVNRNDVHVPASELAKLVVAVTESSSAILTQQPPEQITMSKSLDNTDLLKLGWQPTMDLEDGIKVTWQYFRRFDRNGVWQG